MKSELFDRIIERRNTNCVKWDHCPSSEDIPMWVADMDFQTAPAIIEALHKRVEHGIFGYTLVPDSYYESVVRWFAGQHNWKIEPQWIQYIPGVVPALSVIVKALTEPGDQVIIQTPVYNCFFSSVRNNDCEVVENQLRRVEAEGGFFTYEMDFDDLERKAAHPRAKLLILCNPHNPAGRVWKAEELTRLNDICLRHGVLVVADEIHCELVSEGHRFTPFASLGEAFLTNSITCNSPSKAFNIAGLQIANIICADEDSRARIDRAININEVCDVNPFGVIALQAAYNEGKEWLSQLNQYIEGNYRLLCQMVHAELPTMPIARLEGTYLVWVDIRQTGLSSDQLCDQLLNEGHVMMNSGPMYGAEAGEGYIRINIACPRSRMVEGLERMLRELRIES